jgi:hypothetical protein
MSHLLLVILTPPSSQCVLIRFDGACLFKHDRAQFVATARPSQMGSVIVERGRPSNRFDAWRVLSKARLGLESEEPSGVGVSVGAGLLGALIKRVPLVAGVVGRRAESSGPEEVEQHGEVVVLAFRDECLPKPAGPGLINQMVTADPPKTCIKGPAGVDKLATCFLRFLIFRRGNFKSEFLATRTSRSNAGGNPSPHQLFIERLDRRKAIVQPGDIAGLVEELGSCIYAVQHLPVECIAVRVKRGCGMDGGTVNASDWRQQSTPGHGSGCD